MKQKIKLYKSIIKEISDVIKKHLNESSKIIDTEIGFEFDINDIPVSALRKQYINFHDYLMPRFYDKLTKYENINESVNYTEDAEVAMHAILDRYPLDNWQYKIMTAFNNIHVIVIIPFINENEELITQSMEQLGYYKSDRWLQPVLNMKYIAIRFDPYYPDSLTNDIRRYNYIYHLSPAYNLESIKKNGFIPKSENERFMYPPKLHLIKGNTSKEEIENIGKQLYKANNNPNNTGDYILFSIVVDRIPGNIEFFGDSFYECGICTYDPIPYSAVITTQEMKFNK